MALLKPFLIYSACAAVLVIAVYSADATKCVECSNYDTCNDPLNITAENNTCTLKDKEVCGMISYKDDNGTRTIRSCFNSSISCDEEKNYVKNVTNMKNDTWTCYTCSGELCNKESSGNSFGVPMVALVLGAMASLYFK